MRKELGTFVLLVALCIVVAAINPAFLGGANRQNMARLIGMYGIFSIGMGVVIITGGIDLSVGSVFALQGVILAILMANKHWPWPLAVGTSLLLLAILGVFHGFFIAKVRMQEFMVILCTMLILRSLQ